MKSLGMLLGGVFLALAAVVVFRSKQEVPVDELAHKLEVAWADHHTVV